MTFGENLQFLRKRSGMTQEDLAEQMEVSRQSVSKWESNSAYPEMDAIIRLSGATCPAASARTPLTTTNT